MKKLVAVRSEDATSLFSTRSMPNHHWAQFDLGRILTQSELEPERFFEWPETTPDQCPPADAEATDGPVYRFVKNDPVIPADFERPIDTPRYRKKLAEFSDTELCNLCALSVFTETSDLNLARQALKGFANRKVAAATLSRPHGLAKQDPIYPEGSPRQLDSHINWWVPVGIEPETFFSVVEE